MQPIKKIHIKPLTLLLHSLVWGSFILFLLFLTPIANPVFEKIRSYSVFNSLYFKIFLMALFYFNAYFLIARYFNRRKLAIYITALIVALVVTIIYTLSLRGFASPAPVSKKEIPPEIFSLRPEHPQLLREKNPDGLRLGQLYAIIAPSLLVLIASTAFGLMIKSDKQDKERETEQLKSELAFLHSQISNHSRQVSPPNDYIFVNSDHMIIKIAINDIIYVESLKDYVKIFLAGSSKPIITRLSMKAMEECLPPEKFVRTHKSYIVSVDKIVSIRKNRIKLVDSKVVLISEHYRQLFFNVIDQMGLLR
ncbi:MAG: LytR/AlgR family response regulator transcription factor [Mangrovibacterium sp.]